MRIRSIKPEFWRSPDISQLSIEDRLLFVGLWSYVDDNGVGVDDEAAIVGDLFARDMFTDPRETVARVSRGLARLSACDLITRYEVDGRCFLHVTAWEKHQRIDRPGKPRFPRPDDESATIRESVARPRESAATGTGEQGNRGTEEQGNSNPAPAALVTEADFDRAYSHWPKKVERKKSIEKFRAVARRHGLEFITAKVIEFGDAYAATTAKQFVPALNVWLNGERWTDDLPTPREPQQATNWAQARQDSNLAVLAELSAYESTRMEGIEA